jgi:hypothetical protein
MDMSQTLINIFQVKTPDGLKDFASLLSVQEAFSGGIMPEAIIGELSEPPQPDGPISPSGFVRNRLFVELLHSIVAREAPKQKSFQLEAKRQMEGWVYVIDQRTPNPKGDVPNDDVIGAFEVKNGKIVDGSYVANKNHRILSNRGFFDLGTELYEHLLAELRKRNSKNGKTDA